MNSEAERLEMAKQKLIQMNMKVQRAAAISKKHVLKKKTDPEPIIKKIDKPNEFIFELTESLVEEGFNDEEVVEYIEKVEVLSTCNFSDLEQKEQILIKEIRKMSVEMNQKLYPKEPSVKSFEPELAPKEEEKPKQSPQKSKIPVPSPIKSTKKKVLDNEQPEVQATGAGAQFLASLVSDLSD